jgi:hypothetical protein
MRVLTSLEQLSHVFAEMAVAAPIVVQTAKDAAAHAIKDKVDSIYGDETKLATLSDYTQIARAEKGQSQNEPLLIDGSLLKDSVRIENLGPEAADIGSDEPVHVYHELGYWNVRAGKPTPARPVFHIAAAESEPVVEAIAGVALRELYVIIAGE